jgi:hypothetical protein
MHMRIVSADPQEGYTTALCTINAAVFWFKWLYILTHTKCKHRRSLSLMKQVAHREGPDLEHTSDPVRDRKYYHPNHSTYAVEMP